MVSPTPSQMMASMITHMLGATTRAANRNRRGAMTVRKMTICLPDIFMYIALPIADHSI